MTMVAALLSVYCTYGSVLKACGPLVATKPHRERAERAL